MMLLVILQFFNFYVNLKDISEIIFLLHNDTWNLLERENIPSKFYIDFKICKFNTKPSKNKKKLLLLNC